MTYSVSNRINNNAHLPFYLVIQSKKVIALLIGAMTFLRGIPYYERNTYP